MSLHAARSCQRAVLAGSCLAAALAVVVVAADRRGKVDVLRIGTSGSLMPETGSGSEKGALELLKSLIKDETGLDSEITQLQGWRELTEKMTQGQFEVGVFQGYEFAWAQEQNRELQPVVLAIHVERYPVVYVMTRDDNAASNFAGLEGQSLRIPDTGQRYVRLFIQRQCEAHGKKPEAFFSKITAAENVEDALDDTVDGVVQATVLDRADLEAYKRRKPARFNRLKAVAHSQPFPPIILAQYDHALAEGTLRRFREGLVQAAGKEKTRPVFSFLRLTRFELVPLDLERVLAATRQMYAQTGPSLR
jgi:ABC-type phosphate/phosphonate transport system substrate-binding protein